MNNSQKEELVEYYKNLLILQYNQQGGTARATIDAIIRQVLGALIAQQVEESFNIDTAVGAQLDILGKYLGLDRKTLSYPQLSDEQFRIVLKFAILKNNNMSSTKAISESLYALFGSDVSMVDNKNMSIRYNISSRISQQIVNILIEKNLLPKPMGVKIEIFNGGKFFGFYGSELQTFNNGVFYEPNPPVTDRGTLIVTCDEPFATILINGQETSFKQMETGAAYTWSVSKPGYNTVSGSGIMGNTDVNILIHVLNVEITPTPEYLEINDQEDLNGYFFEAGTTLSYEIYAEKEGYNNLIMYGSTSQTVTITPSMPELTPLCFVAGQTNAKIKYVLHGNISQRDIKYSTDMLTWNSLQADTDITLANKGDIVYFKGNNSYISGPTLSDYMSFVVTGAVSANGNLNSLLDNGNGTTISNIPDYCFFGLFYPDSGRGLKRAPILSGLSVGKYSYYNAFQDTGIKRAPKLPATTIAQGCYGRMFSGCTYMKNTPDLPATTIAQGCYGDMFSGCFLIKKTPKLPATTLAESCYFSMFSNCTSLTEIQEISANTLAFNSCNDMFRGCSSLKKVPQHALSASVLAISCYSGMFEYCTSLEEIPELPATTLENSCYYEMFSGCTSLKKAPYIRAISLARWGFNSMFKGCSSLESIKIAYSGNFTNSNGEFTDWVKGVAASGTLYYNGTDRTTGDSAIPTGWSVQNFN